MVVSFQLLCSKARHVTLAKARWLGVGVTHMQRLLRNSPGNRADACDASVELVLVKMNVWLESIRHGDITMSACWAMVRFLAPATAEKATATA